MSKLAFIFPGQGSQSPGMGRFLFDNFSIVKQVFEEASEAIKIDLKLLCFNSSESDLALTENTQPCLLAVSTATQMVIQKEFGLKPSLTLGHSIGEYASMVLAGSIPFADAVKAVRIRGQAMQSAVPVGKGGMAAIMGLEPDQVETLCKYVEKESGQSPLSPANFNCPGQIVISGSKNALDWAKDNAKPELIWPENPPKRMKLIPLQVSAPFHCSMMKPAEEKMRQVLSDIQFRDAQIPVVQNFTAKTETKASVLRENLILQVSGSVRWMQSMDSVKLLGYTQFIECGNGKVLQGLLKKIDPSFKVATTNSLDELKSLEGALN
jgi:[acyl-carrier-protein] S-malonyltransferase